MKISSPLANFTDSLGNIRESASIYYDSLCTNESSTRAVLIDPILRNLGWDTGNPYMVEVEKQIDQGRVDYALFDSNQELKIIVEAKKLSTDLTDKSIFLSLVRYAFSSGVQDIFLSDGMLWYHYTDFSPGNQEPTKVLSLQEDPLVEIAAYFVQRLDAARYWPEEKDVSELIQYINQVDSEINSLKLEIVKLQNPQKQLNVEKSSIENQIVDTNSKNDFIELTKIINATGTKPSELILPDGTKISVKTWTDVLSYCCKFTMTNKLDIHIPLKDAAGKKVNLLSNNPPPRGVTFFEDKYQGEPVFVYTNYDSNNCIRNSIHIINQLPKNSISNPPAVRFS